MYIGGMLIKRVWRGVVVTLSHLIQDVAFFYVHGFIRYCFACLFFFAMYGLGLGPCAVFFFGGIVGFFLLVRPFLAQISFGCARDTMQVLQ